MGGIPACEAACRGGRQVSVSPGDAGQPRRQRAARAEWLTCARRGCRVWRSDRYRCCCAFVQPQECCAVSQHCESTKMPIPFWVRPCPHRRWADHDQQPCPGGGEQWAAAVDQHRYCATQHRLSPGRSDLHATSLFDLTALIGRQNIGPPQRLSRTSLAGTAPTYTP
jgi:hypothetical protein